MNRDFKTTIEIEGQTVYTSSEMDNKLVVKADIEKVYSKEEMVDILNKKADVSSLEEFVTRDELRTKADLELIGQIGETGFEDTTSLTSILKEIKESIDNKASSSSVAEVKNSVSNLQSILGSISGTGISGNTVAEQLKQIKIRMDGVYSHACAKSTSSSQSDDKIGDLSSTGLNGTTVSEQLTDIKSKFDDGALKLGDISSENTGLTSSNNIGASLKELKTLISSLSGGADKIGSLTGTGFEGTTVTDILTDIKSKIDAISAKANKVDELEQRLAALEGKVTENHPE